MVTSPRQFDVYLVCLDPTIGAEIQKTRPCAVISPNEMNQYINTVIIAPMTTTIRSYPTRVDLTFDGKEGQVVLDQIRTIDKTRLLGKLGTLPESTSDRVLNVLVEMFSKD
jgi:mRNA interferase MazF